MLYEFTQIILVILYEIMPVILILCVAYVFMKMPAKPNTEHSETKNTEHCLRDEVNKIDCVQKNVYQDSDDRRIDRQLQDFYRDKHRIDREQRKVTDKNKNDDWNEPMSASHYMNPFSLSRNRSVYDNSRNSSSDSCSNSDSSSYSSSSSSDSCSYDSGGSSDY